MILTGGYQSFDNAQALNEFPSVCPLVLVILLDLSTWNACNVVLSVFCEGVHLFKDDVVDIEPEKHFSSSRDKW